MDEKDMMRRKIAMQDFVLWELGLFLDAQPDNKTAASMFTMNKEKLAKLMTEYESKYGPLDQRHITPDNRWAWVADPWPWDYSETGGV